jgi:hypothetical protein
LANRDELPRSITEGASLLRRCAGHADIKMAMITNTPGTLPSKLIHFDNRSIP